MLTYRESEGGFLTIRGGHAHDEIIILNARSLQNDRQCRLTHGMMQFACLSECRMCHKKSG